MEKIETLFSLLAARYGAFELKPGQSLDLIKKTWCHSVGRYEKGDIKAAALEYFKTAKYSRWPEEGQIIELLKAAYAKPESEVVDDRPANFKEAQRQATAFFNSILAMPSPEGAFPFTYTHAFNHICGLNESWALGKSFGWLIAQAWMNRKIPDDFEKKAAVYFSEMKRRKDIYLKGVKDHGAMRIHEGVVKLPFTEAVPVRSHAD